MQELPETTAIEEKEDFVQTYEIGDLLGRGAMGSVYRAHHRLLGRDVAIKFLHPHLLDDNNSLLRFNSELHNSAGLKHRNVASVLAGGVTDDRPYLVMELVHGIGLDEKLSQDGKLAEDDFCSIFTQVLDALDYIHENGVIHRDIKPGNILLERDQDGAWLPKIIDFGIARVTDESLHQNLTAPNAPIGTPAYMSPEHCSGQALTTRSDLYSLGCVMYESWAGFKPYDAEAPLEVMYKHTNAPFPDLPVGTGVQHNLINACIRKSMQKQPQDRFASAKDFAAALQPSKENIRALGIKVKKPFNWKALSYAAALLMVPLVVACAFKYHLDFQHMSNERFVAEQSAVASRRQDTTGLSYKSILGLAEVGEEKAMQKTGSWPDVYYYLTKALAKMEGNPAVTSRELAEVYLKLGYTSATLEKPDEALTWFNKAQAAYSPDPASETFDTQFADVRILRAANYIRLNKPDLAKADLDFALAYTLAHKNGKWDEYVARIEQNIGDYYAQSKLDYKTAIPHLETARRINASFGDNQFGEIMALQELIICYMNIGDVANAKRCQDEWFAAAEICKVPQSEEHRKYIRNLIPTTPSTAKK